jgi:hypothetical protein
MMGCAKGAYKAQPRIHATCTRVCLMKVRDTDEIKKYKILGYSDVLILSLKLIPTINIT